MCLFLSDDINKKSDKKVWDTCWLKKMAPKTYLWSKAHDWLSTSAQRFMTCLAQVSQTVGQPFPAPLRSRWQQEVQVNNRLSTDKQTSAYLISVGVVFTVDPHATKIKQLSPNQIIKITTTHFSLPLYTSLMMLVVVNCLYTCSRFVYIYCWPW